jgi:hypothetical protein
VRLARQFPKRLKIFSAPSAAAQLADQLSLRGL